MKSPKSKNKKIEYGNVDIPDEAFLPENIKERISINVQGNILAWFKEHANLIGVPYQNIMQMALAEYYLEHKKIDELVAKNQQQLKKRA